MDDTTITVVDVGATDTAIAPVSTATPPAPDIKVDFSKWKIKDYKAWDKVVGNPEWDTLAAVLSGVIVAWPYAGDPRDIAAYDELSAEEWVECQGAVSAGMQEAFQRSGRAVLARGKNGAVGRA